VHTSTTAPLSDLRGYRIAFLDGGHVVSKQWGRGGGARYLCLLRRLDTCTELVGMVGSTSEVYRPVVPA
jgi:hypothetical protein